VMTEMYWMKEQRHHLPNAATRPSQAVHEGYCLAWPPCWQLTAVNCYHTSPTVRPSSAMCLRCIRSQSTCLPLSLGWPMGHSEMWCMQRFDKCLYSGTSPNSSELFHHHEQVHTSLKGENGHDRTL
jgi:hypothetical protein